MTLTVSTADNRLDRQLQFIIEIDKMKQIFRRTLLTDGSRQENDAEHSWHLSIMAVLLSEYSAVRDIDLLRVIKMALIHDLVEIDAGDTYCYDEKGYEDKEEREKKAAARLFSLLPEDQAAEIWELWREFEELSTPESRFAACMDRFEIVFSRRF